jgi:prepilin-type N-terminal cleavage/methylation domain-containing protein
MNSSQWTRRGVTLIELLIVVAIVVILGATVPMLTSGVVVERQMYNTAAQLQQDLLLVQNMAVTHSSGGPPGGSPRYLMRLYLGDNAFAYETTETYSAPTPSVPSPSSGIVMRRMTSVFGFPAFFGKTSPASVTIGSSTTATSGYVDIVFDNQGLPYWSVDDGMSWTSAGTKGSVMIVNGSLSKQMRVDVSVIGRVSIAWVKR